MDVSFEWGRANDKHGLSRPTIEFPIGTTTRTEHVVCFPTGQIFNAPSAKHRKGLPRVAYSVYCVQPKNIV